MIVFWVKFQRSLLLWFKSTKLFHHWFMEWHMASSVASHYLNPVCWLIVNIRPIHGGKHIVLFPAKIWGKWLINGTKKNNQSQYLKHPAKSAQLWLVGCVLDFFLVELKLQNIKIFILIVTLQFCYCCHLMHNHVVGKGAFGKMHRNYFFKHRD